MWFAKNLRSLLIVLKTINPRELNSHRDNAQYMLLRLGFKSRPQKKNSVENNNNKKQDDSLHKR